MNPAHCKKEGGEKVTGETHKRLVKEFEYEIVPRLAKVLSIVKSDLEKQPLTSFAQAARMLMQAAVEKFVQKHPEHPINEKLQQAFLMILISKLNEVLPLTYPYVVVLLEIKEKNTGLRLACITRSSIPVLNDSLHTDIVPILRIDREETLDPTKRRTMEVKFYNQ